MDGYGTERKPLNNEGLQREENEGSETQREKGPALGRARTKRI